jgi:anaerobic selenocysteine-containing dehydrogenase
MLMLAFQLWVDFNLNTYLFGTFGPVHLKKVKAGIDCFNAAEYWECHEALEEVWLEDVNDPARNVYWAIIQVAASMYHYQNGNHVGAWGLMKKAQEKFRRCEEQSIETDLCFKYLDWQELKELVFQVNEKTPLVDYKTIYDFRFKNYQENIK